MIVTCEKCATAYSLDDEKIKGRDVLKMKCSRCGHLWVQDLLKPAGEIIDKPEVESNPVAENVVKASKVEEVKSGLDVKPKDAYAAFDLDKYLDDVAGKLGEQKLVEYDEKVELPAHIEPLEIEDKSVPNVISLTSKVEEAPIEKSEAHSTEKKEDHKVAALKQNQELASRITTPARGIKVQSSIHVPTRGSILPSVVSSILLLLLLVASGVCAIKFQDEILMRWPSLYRTYADFSLLRNVPAREAFRIEPASVKVKYTEIDGKVNMIIEGAITNTFFRDLPTPELRADIKNDQGATLVDITFYPQKIFLNPNETVIFSETVENPPVFARKVSVAIK